MKKMNVSILLLAFCISYAYCEAIFPDEPNAAAAQQNALLAELEADARYNDAVLEPLSNNYEKRMERYGFGLGRRSYTLTTGNNGIKRLPIYNFGLGKRGRPYSFGLGKRFDYDDERDLDFDLMDEKRNRPYSFGLGKRAVDKREVAKGKKGRYDFGLGRR